MKLKTIVITPKIAADLLAKNPENRAIRQSHVSNLANEMASGRWLPTAQGISLDTDGNVVDGQHRLSAIIKSGVSVEMVVASGVPRESLDVYDLGAKRSTADILHLRDGLINCNLATAAARCIVSLCFGYQSYVLSVGLTRRVLAEFGEEIQDAIHLLSSIKQTRKAWIVGATAFGIRYDKSIRQFAEGMGSGEIIAKGDPAFAARNWLLNGKSDALISGSFKAAAYEILFNCMFAHTKGARLVSPARGLQGINHYRAKAKVFIENMRPEAARMRSITRKSKGWADALVVDSAS